MEISVSCSILKVKENMLIGGDIMANRIIYPNIDMQKTGRKLKRIIESAGFTPRMIQEYLHLSCVQPIYRWYKGSILPSVDYYGVSEKYGEFREWDGGYSLREKEIFNPRAVIEHLSNKN